MNKKLILRKPDHRPHTSILKEKHTENRKIESERKKKQEYAKQKKVSKLFFLKKKMHGLHWTQIFQDISDTPLKNN